VLDELHTRIRNAREQAGFSQREMAEELGVGRTTYVNFETGRSRLFNPLLDRLAARLGMSVEELLFGERPDEQLLRDSTALEQWRRNLVSEYEQRLNLLQERLDAASRVIDAQGTTIRTLSDSNQFLMTQLSKDE
jgi:transcriptional regulator with XRE-family HTH domain